ncbi:hypothetical protein Dthio_PD0713 [Desulfonatronospira thiodismutans ASO3-1]|uniref:Type II secretion system protein n=1 Tax=Desulfonatronospira thiodismutans ASO3-1 TaxID=555779 RepID=D6SRR6_9BACT|nr:type II secretion system protein [Desulfonatronospira thiodismutans]EFI33382.1 hypothetical protein Dthio_PD0713 [Desulfonatronospira thiodismutans ASO3-1]
MNKKSRGFTLLEVIAVLVVGGIVAALLVPFMSSAVVDSHKPLDNLRSSSGVSSEMVKVIANFKPNWNPVPPPCDGLEGKIEDFVEDKEENEEEWNAEFADDSPRICGFDDNFLECDSDPLPTDRVLEVTLQDKDNPGFRFTYYFPCN